MLSLILFLLGVWVVLCLALTAWTIWFQNYLYLQVAEGAFWRAPLVGTIVTLYLCVWSVLGYRAIRADPTQPNPYATTFAFSPTREIQYQVLWTTSRKPGSAEGGEPGKSQRTRYERVKTGSGTAQYRKDGKVHGEELPARPEEIIVQEDGEEISFKPDRDAKGNFKVEEIKFLFASTKKGLCYRDRRNRVMEEGNLGVISTWRTGPLIVNCLLNFLHLVIWFVCFWLLLRFQPGHSLLIALGCWLVMTFCVVSPVLACAETAARGVPQLRASTQQSSSLMNAASQKLPQLALLQPSSS